MPIQFNHLVTPIVLALLGIGAPLVLPKWVGFVFIVAAFYVFVFWGIKREKRSLAAIGIAPIILIILGIFGFFGSIAVIWHGVNLAWPPDKKEIKDSTPPGKVQTERLPTTPPRFRENVEKIYFQLGGRGFNFGYDIDKLGQNKVKPFNLGGHSPVTLYVEGGMLYADVTIYGGIGKTPIEIVHNEFVVRRPGWDKNYNRDAFEVVDDKLNPIFQFIYKSKTHIIVNGIFPYPGGLILANDDGVLINPILPTNFSLKRILKYPSSKYLGQLDDVFKPRQQD